jgi:hypothetical protein
MSGMPGAGDMSADLAGGLPKDFKLPPGFKF